MSSEILHGDSLLKLKELADNSVDSVVCDPPYFLTNSSGSGFMGKEWDSLSVGNAFAEGLLRSLAPVWLMAEENSVQESANTKINSQNQAKNIYALYVARKPIAQNPSLNLGTFSVLQNVITRAEALALSIALCPSLTNVFESQGENVLYVVPNLFTEKSSKSTALQLATMLHKVTVGEDLKTLNTLMGGQETSGPIEATTGPKSGWKFISATTSDVKNVESIVVSERYNATTLSPINSQEIIHWLTSLRFVRNAMERFTANPGNIQLLSEKFFYNIFSEVLRVLKPGGHLLSFGGTRTYHRMACAIEDAGFEIRDQLQWLYGSGFPKSLNIGKAIDKAAGVEREVIGENPNNRDRSTHEYNSVGNVGSHALLTAPATDDAKKWEGFGTALKPANEPIVLARKPLSEKTVALNVLKWGTGGLNIDGSRIATDERQIRTHKNGGQYAPPIAEHISSGGQAFHKKTDYEMPQQGRWPANLLLDETAAEVLDEQSGVSQSTKRKTGQDYAHASSNINVGGGNKNHEYTDSGGASRFFYVAKASKRERNAGLEGMPEVVKPLMGEFKDNPGRTTPKSSPTARANHHPTVKPIKLMEYLIKLVTPPNGLVLDPFCGSGSTGVAAKRLGFKFIGIELNSEYIEIAKKRIEFAKERAGA